MKVLNFVRCFFCVYGDECVVFVLCFIDVAYFINQFSNIKPPLHSWDKSHMFLTESFLLCFWIYLAGMK